MNRTLGALLLFAVVSACATPSRPTATDAVQPPAPVVAQPSGPTRMTVALMGAHTTMQSRTAGASRPGYDAMEELVSAGMGNWDDKGQLRLQLAAQAPTIENGLWKIYPDGHMETTWKIRPDARWHDGAPFTSDDILFTATVTQDPELLNFRNSAHPFIDRTEAPDPLTVTVTWNGPYIEADALYTGSRMVPLPKHLLENAYQTNKAHFMELPYWGTEFIGTGPFKVQELQPGTKLLLRAFDQYVRGRPKIDELEVRFIPDPNAVVANVLAGEVDAVIGRGLSLEQAVQVRDQWKAGKVDVALEAWVAVFPQMINPSPAAIGDVRFRRGLLQSIDRQEMVDTIQYGLAPVADSVINPAEGIYPATESSIVRYTYDPRLAAEGFQSAGFTRGADGTYRDGSGQQVTVEIRTTGDDVQAKSMLAIADSWQRAGVRTDQVVVPQARINDRQYRAQRPGFELSRYPANPTIDSMQRFHTSQAPVAGNNFTGANKSRYSVPEVDTLLDRYFGTIPLAERGRILAQIVRQLTTDVVPLPLFHDGRTALISNGVQNVGARRSVSSSEGWNAELWTTN